MKSKTQALSGAVALGCLAASARVDYPERPINMFMPFDVEGANGSVAVKNANPDGYTKIFARIGSHTVRAAMKVTLPYTLDDFRFIDESEQLLLQTSLPRELSYNNEQ